LTSQHFVNLYLGKLDHHVKNELRCPGYVRSMDDFLLFDDDRERLKRWLTALHTWLDREFRLRIKPTIQLLPTARGVPYLGMRVKPTHVTLLGVRKRRVARALRGYALRFSRGVLTGRDHGARLNSLFSHCARARSHGFLTDLLRRLAAAGLPDCEPERERARRREQRPRLPACSRRQLRRQR